MTIVLNYILKAQLNKLIQQPELKGHCLQNVRIHFTVS